MRKRFISNIGVRATHAAEDGALVGFFVGVILTYPPLAALLLGLMGLPSKARPAAVLKAADEVVRQDAIEAQPLYFVVLFVAFLGAGAGVGSGAEALAAASGVSLAALL
jgi:hypothetical protein